MINKCEMPRIVRLLHSSRKIIPLVVVICFIGGSARSQSYVPIPRLPADVSASSPEPQRREPKPELVLQTGNKTSFGVACLLFSPDGRLLVTTTRRSPIVKLWETATGRELRNLQSGSEVLPDSPPLVAFSRTGHLIGTVGSENSINVWDVVSGRRVALFTESQKVEHLAFIDDLTLLTTSATTFATWNLKTGNVLTRIQIQSSSEIAISNDARKLATLSLESSQIVVRLVDLPALDNIRSFNLPVNSLTEARVFFGPDNNLSVAGISQRHLQLWELTSTWRQHDMGIVVSNQDSAAFSENGKLFAVAESGRVKIWDLEKRRHLFSLRTDETNTTSNREELLFAISGDGKKVATGGGGSPTVLWDAKTGKQPLKLNGRTNPAYQVVFSPDGNRLISGGRTSWDLRAGRGLRTVPGLTESMKGFPSPTGRLIAVAETKSGELTIRDTQTGRQIRKLVPSANGGVVISAHFSSDGELLATIYSNADPRNQSSSVVMWQLSSGRELQTITLGTACTDAVFGADGSSIALLDSSGRISILNTKDGVRVREVSNHTQTTAIAFSPKGMTLAIGNTRGEVNLWDPITDRSLGGLNGPQRRVTNIAFSDDGQLIATTGSDNTIQLWDLNSRRELRSVAGQSGRINSLDFNPNSHLLASSGDDGSTFLWDTRNGEHLLTLISLDDGGEWIVVTPQGIFDGTPVSWNQILWRYNQDTFNVAPIEWFFNEFYYPGLLADIFNGKRPRVTQDVSLKDRRQPVVKVSLGGPPPGETGLSTRKVRVKIDITDAPPDKDNSHGSGARDLRLFRNGALVKFWPGDVLKGASHVTLDEEVTITAGPNRLTAYAFNKDNVKSKDALLAVPGAQSLRREGTAYIIAIGINEYANPQYNLKYAIADAQSFGDELRRQLSTGSRFKHIEVVPLLNQAATKANIISALSQLTNGRAASATLPATFQGLREVGPEDTVIIYFAGHGMVQGSRFFLIPHDLGFMGEREIVDEQDLGTISSHSISDLELAQTGQGMDAGHLLLFFDACNSGQALEADEKRRGPMNSKGLAQLAYEKGMYILTAAQSYQAAIEAGQLGHGLLTYALVEEGLKTNNADSEPRDGILTAREWLDFATERVPQMQEEKIHQRLGIGLGLAFTYGEEEIDPAKRSLQRPRAFYRRELEASPWVVTGSAPDIAAVSGPGSRSPIARWIDLQTATLGVRYRFVANSQGTTVTNQLQDHLQLRGRFKFDENGNYSINAGVFTGNRFMLGFDDTGIGTGDLVTNLYLKQLYFSAKPITGVELQFGGLYFNRGESTEITTYDNDGYLTGERIVIQRPQDFFFDEISATYGFLGDLNTPNINKRWHRLKESNYHQFLISKRFEGRAVVSADYTFQSGVDTIRQAFRVNTPEFKPIDFFRLEFYERLQHNPKAGLAAYAEKGFFERRLAVGGGYANIDRDYGPLNGDRFTLGQRFFVNASYKLSPEFTISTFYTHAFNNSFNINNNTRFEIFFTYNLLRTLQKAGIF